MRIQIKKMKNNFNTLQDTIGVFFNRIELLEEALTHRSYINENTSWPHRNNERLEFLGDAVLELVTTDALFRNFPKEEEGVLTIYRAALVNTKSLAEVAQKIGLDKEVLLSKGEAKSFEGRGRESISANTTEAVIGAIYIDQGYEGAKKFIIKFIYSRIDMVVADGGKDPKSLVQELAQREYKITPTYEVLDESGPAHKREFKVGLYFNGDLKTNGMGNSKQEAETNAAEVFLKKHTNN